MKIHERIRYLRKDILNLTQQEFSNSLKISRANEGNIEIGRISVTERVISDICEKFNVSEEWLRTGQGETFKEHPAVDEVASYVEDLLDHEAVENPFFDIIVEMMRTYHELDEPARIAALKYFRKLRENLEQKKEG